MSDEPRFVPSGRLPVTVSSAETLVTLTWNNAMEEAAKIAKSVIGSAFDPLMSTREAIKAHLDEAAKRIRAAKK